MPTTNEQVIETLNRLLAVCKGSEQGFRAAADAVKDGERRTALKHYAQQRARLASELRMEIRLLGGEPETLNGMSVPQELDRLVAASLQDDERTALLECARMETLVCQAFESALADTNVPTELLAALRRQHTRIRDTAHAVQALVGGAGRRVAETELHPA